MLVLSRKCGEQITIEGDIEVTVLSIQRGRVRLGISAPQDVSIRRVELPLSDISPSRKNTEYWRDSAACLSKGDVA